MPSGVGNSGRKFLPKVSVRLQRLAISSVLASASGTSAKRSATSCGVAKYWLRANSCGRFLSASVQPPAMHTRASWAVKSSRAINCAGWVATTGKSISCASFRLPETAVSHSGCSGSRCNSR